MEGSEVYVPVLVVEMVVVEVVPLLGLIAVPLNEDDWGSMRQVDAENKFFEMFELMVTRACFDAVEEYGLKATTEERVIYAIQNLYEYFGDTVLPQSVFNPKTITIAA